MINKSQATIVGTVASTKAAIITSDIVFGVSRSMFFFSNTPNGGTVPPFFLLKHDQWKNGKKIEGEVVFVWN